MRNTLAAHSLLAFTCVLGCLSAGAVHASGTSQEVGISRLAVSFEERQKHQVKAQLRSKGYNILTEGPGFFAVTHSSLAVPSSRAAAAAHGAGKAGRKLIERAQEQQRDQHLANLRVIPGVHTSEQDLKRYLHVRPVPDSNAAARRRLSAVSDAAIGASPAEHLTGHWHTKGSFKPDAYDVWGNSVGDQVCAGQDIQLADTAGSETIPWGIKRIGALNDTVRNAQPKGRVIVCIIDSGLSGDHPEYKKTLETSDRITGCKESANCPYVWTGDIVGHGTHVAGTIAAPQNGLGVIGVINDGAELHIVRVWNDSGDVSQGQGPYATDLVLAYDNCLSYLLEQQKKDKNAKMVINMSYGSAGPLTVERLWMEKAAKRGDMIFVGSAGNNGSWLPTPAYGDDFAGSSSEEAVGQYLSYPASYDLEEVMSVANARCDGTIDFSSQKNKQVSIAAPGMAILSSVPKYYGAVRAYITTSTPLPPQTEPVPTPDKRSSGWLVGWLSRSSNSSNAVRTRAGLGILPNGYREPRPIQGTAIGSSGMLPLVQCSVDKEVRAAAYKQVPEKMQRQKQQGPGCPGASGAVCMIELPGSIDWYHETCIAMLSCIQGGGKGLILWRDDKMLEGMYSPGQDYMGYYGFQPDEILLGVQINCGTRCSCWSELKKLLGCADGSDCSGKAPPGIVVSAKHAEALKATAVAAAAAAAGKNPASGLRVNVTNYEYDYRHYDGTSMAAPHVSGAAALLWRLVPNCRAADITQALKSSAEKLPDQKGVDIAAGSGMVRVDLAYDWILKNKACAVMEKSSRPAAKPSTTRPRTSG